jgi:hypothetical protein
METVDKFPEEFGPGTPFEAKYPFVKILRLLHEGTAVGGLLAAGVGAELITPQEKQYIESIYGQGTGTIEEIQAYPNLASLYNAKNFKGQEVTNSKGQLVTSGQGVDTTNPKFQMGFHLLGNLAKKMKEYLNADKQLMTSFFKAVLNKSSMVQVYTYTNRSDKGVWFDKFDVVWPPTFTGTIEIESDFYTSNAKPSKKISFVFK